MSIDFVIGLPPYKETGFNSILVVVDRLTKMRHLIPIVYLEGKSNAKAVAKAFLTNV